MPDLPTLGLFAASASASYARRRRVTGRLYLLVAIVALVGGRRHAT